MRTTMITVTEELDAKQTKYDDEHKEAFENWLLKRKVKNCSRSATTNNFEFDYTGLNRWKKWDAMEVGDEYVVRSDWKVFVKGNPDDEKRIY